MPDATSCPNVVFVTAHPDDVAFSFGGTAWLLKERYKLHVLCATRGERGYAYSGPGLAPPSPEVAAARAHEEADAGALLGADLTFLGFADSEIFAGRAECEKVAGLLEALQPAAVFTHGFLEKPDHAATANIALHALQLAGRFWTTELYFIADCGPAYNTRPDVYVNISPAIEGKRRLIRCHKHHIQSEADVEHWIAGNRALGRLAWCEFAEAYTTSLPLMAARWKRKAGSILMDLPVTSG